MQTSLTLDWADGSYDFRLPFAAGAEIERKANVGIETIYRRVMTGDAYTVDVVEIIRQGLLGGTGGMVDGRPVETKPALVNALIERYVIGREALPFLQNVEVAQAILVVFMQGHESAQKKSAADDPELTSELTQPRSSPTAP